MSFKIDNQAVNTEGYEWDKGEKIDHAASAKANLSSAGDHLVQGFTPDKIGECIKMMRDPGPYGVGAVLGWLALPWAAAIDLVELPVRPLLAVKDAADAAVHGILSLFKK